MTAVCLEATVRTRHDFCLIVSVRRLAATHVCSYHHLVADKSSPQTVPQSGRAVAVVQVVLIAQSAEAIQHVSAMLRKADGVSLLAWLGNDDLVGRLATAAPAPCSSMQACTRPGRSRPCARCAAPRKLPRCRSFFYATR
jgi:hypothetical protein